MLGGSAGLAVAAGLRVAAGLDADQTVVVLAPDSGRAYLSKYHSVTWLRQSGFLDDDRPGLLVDNLPPIGPITVAADLTVADALSTLAPAGRAQAFLPVVLARPARGFGVAGSEVLGTLRFSELEAAATTAPDQNVLDIADAPAFVVGSGETAAEAAARLGVSAPERRVIVVRDGRVAQVTTYAALTASPVRRVPGAAKPSRSD